MQVSDMVYMYSFSHTEQKRVEGDALASALMPSIGALERFSGRKSVDDDVMKEAQRRNNSDDRKRIGRVLCVNGAAK